MMVENKYLVNNKISSQYFVIYPLLAMTEVKHFCKSSQGFHTLLLVFWPIPPCRSPLEQGCFGAVVGATRTFNSLQRFSMGLRSGDWLGHSRTLKCFLRSHSFVARAVCLGSLSCWKTQPRFIFNALADGRRFSLKISRYMAPFILSFTQISRPGPFAEKQPQSMMFPPPCFTVGMVFFGCNSTFFLLQTRQVEFLPKSSILVSSDHMTFSQSSSGSSKCSLANFRRAWTCTGLSRGTRLALQDLSPWRRSVLLMVAFVTLVPALCRSFTRSPRVVLGFLWRTEEPLKEEVTGLWEPAILLVCRWTNTYFPP